MFAGTAPCVSCRDGADGDMGEYPGVFGPDRKKSFTPTIRSPTATRPITGSMISPKGIMERFSLSLLFSLVDIQFPPLPEERQEQLQPHPDCSRPNNRSATKGRNPFQDPCLQHVRPNGKSGQRNLLKGLHGKGIYFPFFWPLRRMDGIS